MWAGIAQSVQWLTTTWMVCGSNPGGGKSFCTDPDQPWGPPRPYTMGSGLFPTVKLRVHGIDHPPSSSAHLVPLGIHG